MLFCILLASLDGISTATPITICEQTYLGRLSNLLPDDFPLIGFVLSDCLTQRYRLPEVVSQRPLIRPDYSPHPQRTRHSACPG
jgi:hypothetical protein